MLALPNRLKVINSLSLPDAGQNLALFAKPIFGNYYLDRLANHLFRGVAEDPLRTVVPACTDAVQVLAYDRVITRLDDRAYPTQALFTFAKVCFDLNPLDKIRSLPSQHVQRSKLVLCWGMWLLPMARYHAQQPPGARDERR